MQNKQKYLILLLTSLFLCSCSKNNDKINFLNKSKKNQSSEPVKKTASLPISIKKQQSSAPILNVFDNKSDSSEVVTQSKHDPSKIDVSLIPIKFSIQYKNGTGENQIAVFLDLNQDYSKTFIENIPKINNSTVNVFLANGDQEAIEKIYCSEDQKQSLISYLNSLKIDNANRNCNKDGLEYSNKYFQDYLNDKKLPILIFSDGNFVENSINANSDLINQYLSGK